MACESRLLYIDSFPRFVTLHFFKACLRAVATLIRLVLLKSSLVKPRHFDALGTIKKAVATVEGLEDGGRRPLRERHGQARRSVSYYF